MPAVASAKLHLATKQYTTNNKPCFLFMIPSTIASLFVLKFMLYFSYIPTKNSADCIQTINQTFIGNRLS